MMKKNNVLLTVLAVGLSFTQVQGQIIKQKDITQEEIYAAINKMSEEKDIAVRDAALIKEADAMLKSKSEQYVNIAASIYKFIGKKEKAEEIDKSIVKKFPKGVRARYEAYNTIFKNEQISAEEAVKQVKAWEKKFPISSFEEKNRGVYDQAKSKIIELYFKENNIAKAKELLEDLKISPNYIIYGNFISSALIANEDFKNSEDILKDIYPKVKSMYKSTDETVKKNESTRYYPPIAFNYGKTLLNNGNKEQAIQVYDEVFKDVPSYKSSPKYFSMYIDALRKVGRDLDAYLLIDNFFTSNGKDESLLSIQKELYTKLNGNLGSFDQYVANLDKKVEESLITKYKGELIKKEAPQFSLEDRDGKKVSLSDYKGKVVIVDFWATWCGPCKNSFPGMQAAINKFKDDKDVVFLFIDTWQREDNYKELVNEFIEKNNYTFHVLFDEMKDKEKATTTAYGVKGIPHKVVIDKEGFIRFESSGSGSDINKIVQEMSLKIDLAKNAK